MVFLTIENFLPYLPKLGQNMSVMGSALEIDMDPDGDVLQGTSRHVGNTGTGCFRMHDHLINDTKKPIMFFPPTEKIEATYLYAPTPDPTPEPSEADPDAEGDEGDHADQDGDHKKNGNGPGRFSANILENYKNHQKLSYFTFHG